MAVVYSQTAIDARLQAVADVIDASGNGHLKLYAGDGTLLSNIQLSLPCGTVDAGVLTFGGDLLDTGAAATGYAGEGKITDAGGTVVISGLSVGIALSGADIEITNGLNNTLITAGQSLKVLSAQITGS